MSTPSVILALQVKRAELSGEILTAKKRLEKLRDDLDAIDRALRVFDPSQTPEKIRPVIKRKGERLFAYGECTRAILNAMRKAGEPVTAVQLAERVALDCAIKTEIPGIEAKLSRMVTATLVRLQKRGVVVGEGKPPRWGASG